MAYLQLTNIHKNFGSTQVLKGVDLSLEKGEVLSIIGSSGSGKTTLLRCINFLETPNIGSMVLDGETLFDCSVNEKESSAQLREKTLNFGMVFQSFNLFPQYTVFKNITLAPTLLIKHDAKVLRDKLLQERKEQLAKKAQNGSTVGGKKLRTDISENDLLVELEHLKAFKTRLKSAEKISAEDVNEELNFLSTFENKLYEEEKILTVKEINKQVEEFKDRRKKEIAEYGEELLAKIGLVEKRNSYPCELSGGQQQRVAIARALAIKPKVLCFDEPTSALDPELTGEVLKVIRSLKDEGRTMIIVTHEMGFAKHVSDKILFMADGVVEEEGDPVQLIENPRSEKLKAFLSNVSEKEEI
ncbi:MAG: ATP-binding cassette domain-containing protein [Clostridiales bacterium]|nr:ATP-binding cassette domain-containing protein [Clostridiales bacterium]